LNNSNKIPSKKKAEIRAMFNSIALRYDFLNHFFSFGIDISWRKKLIRELRKYNPEKVLDVATGTADLAIMAAQHRIPTIIGVDLSANMVAIGNEKIIKENLQEKIDLQIGDAEDLNFQDDFFDAAMISFGIRNFENIEKGLTEINRVLKDGSPLLVLEFSKPTVFPVKQAYWFYSKAILPLLGRLISKDKSAYTYLPDSIAGFLYGKALLEVFERCGFEKCRFRPLTFQVATIYVGFKKTK